MTLKHLNLVYVKVDGWWVIHECFKSISHVFQVWFKCIFWVLQGFRSIFFSKKIMVYVYESLYKLESHNTDVLLEYMLWFRSHFFLGPSYTDCYGDIFWGNICPGGHLSKSIISWLLLTEFWIIFLHQIVLCPLLFLSKLLFASNCFVSLIFFCPNYFCIKLFCVLNLFLAKIFFVWTIIFRLNIFLTYILYDQIESNPEFLWTQMF